ncbi:MICOS complex subunit MIC13, partial [Lemmus lemmus]
DGSSVVSDEVPHQVKSGEAVEVGAVHLVYDQELLGSSEAALRKAEEVVLIATYQFSQYVCQQTGLEMPQLPAPAKINFPNLSDSWNSDIIFILATLSMAPTKAPEYSKEDWGYMKKHSK